MNAPAPDTPAATGGGRRVRAANAALATDAQAFVDSHREMGTTELFGITELCKEFGITLRALRFYEDKGLLAPRRDNGAQQLDYVIARTDAAIAELEQKRAEIEKTLAELRVINATCRGHLEARRATAGKRLEDGVN